MFNFFKNNKLPERVRKAITPREEFVQKTKGRFLATFDAHYGVIRPARRFTFAVKALAVVLVFFGATAGISVYADSQNVSPDSPLYPLKRLNETVELSLASPQNKPQLEATFAARRAVEINTLEKDHPSSTLIPALANDLDKDVNASIETSVAISDGQKNNLCGQVFSILSTSSSAIHGELAAHPRVIIRFEGQCGGTIASAAPTTTSSVSAATAASATATATGSVSAPSLPLNIHL